MWVPAVVSWPSEAARRTRLHSAGLPCLLLVEADVALPDDLDLDLEDWVRLPASDEDVLTRARQLGVRRAESIVLEDLVLSTGATTMTLSPREAGVMTVMLRDRYRMTTRSALLDCLDIGEGSSARPLHDVVHRLRQLLRAEGIDLYAARSKGYLLGLRVIDDDPMPDAPRPSAPT